MDRFVCVRLVQAIDLDLSVFQFDWHRALAVFLMNAEKGVYARYEGTPVSDLEGFKKTLEGALEVHKAWPGNRAALAGKSGTPMPWKSPAEMSVVKEKRWRRTSTNSNCMHCHNIMEALTRSYQAVGQAVPDRFYAPHPLPQRVGLMLDPKERATVIDVSKTSEAGVAGVQVGDRITAFNGQPILSPSDLQWALFAGPDQGPVPAELDRAGRQLSVTLQLPKGWRSR
jgi:hypothetical protein